MEITSKKILIVDDLKSNLITGKFLEKEGHNVLYAKDYSEAVKIAGFERYPKNAPGRKENGIDIFLTDLYLPWGEDRGKPFREHEMDGSIIDGTYPLGYGLVLSALANGIPYIGMITNQNHHGNAVTATWDYLPQSPIRKGNTVLGIWDERGCVAEDECGNYDEFYQSTKDHSLVRVPCKDRSNYENNPLWVKVEGTIKQWDEAVRRLLSFTDKTE